MEWIKELLPWIMGSLPSWISAIVATLCFFLGRKYLELKGISFPYPIRSFIYAIKEKSKCIGRNLILDGDMYAV